MNVVCLDKLDDTSSAEWDDLRLRSWANHVFLTAGWLRAWDQHLHANKKSVYVIVREKHRAIAAGALVFEGGAICFAGRGPSDYCDFLVDTALPAVTQAEAVSRILSTVMEKFSQSSVELQRIRSDSPSRNILARLPGLLFTSWVKGSPAPTMDISVVDEKLRKKSLKRHAKGLKKLGEVLYETFDSSSAILPQLDEFFEQHEARWRDTGSPSLFLDANYRCFYESVVKALGDLGSLRFSTVRLDGKLAAAHFGFHHNGSFIWYKPTFDPELSSKSPGEALLKYLLEQARDEKALEFDFTIGHEAFKSRFATEVRQVWTAKVTQKRLKHGLNLLKSAIKKS